MPASDHSAFSSRSPFAKAWLIAALALGCTPKIGDECTVSTNCSATGDRLCDITQPGGYCTVFNCEPGTCPEDSVCLNFGTTLSSVASPVCAPSQGNSPYQRSFCMATCGSSGDCRGGYACEPPSSIGAVLAEYSGNPKVCAVAPHQPPMLAGGAGGMGGGYLPVETGVCDGYNGGASNAGATNGTDAGTAGDAGATGN